jgi:hypothetical protein
MEGEHFHPTFLLESKGVSSGDPRRKAGAIPVGVFTKMFECN